MRTATTSVIDALPPGWLDIGAKGLVVLAVIMIFTGRLVNGKERDHWRDMAMELKEQNSKLIAGAETTQQFMRSFPVQGDKE
jgi:hypothetical protein